MNEATIAQTIMTFLVLSIFLGFLIWAIKTGQFKNVEEAKYQVVDKEKVESDNDEVNKNA